MLNNIKCPARIPRITKEINKLWEKYPQLRLGQFIYNALYFNGLKEEEIFYIDDERLLEVLQSYDKKCNQERK